MPAGRLRVYHGKKMLAQKVDRLESFEEEPLTFEWQDAMQEEKKH